jgi:hypothetical protein
MLWLKRTWITVTGIAEKLDISCRCAYSIIHENLDSLQMSTNRIVWKYAYSFCSDIMKKEKVSCNGLPQVMKYGSTL